MNQEQIDRQITFDLLTALERKIGESLNSDQICAYLEVARRYGYQATREALSILIAKQKDSEPVFPCTELERLIIHYQGEDNEQTPA